MSFTDGKKYNGCKENYLKFRELSDDLCYQYELSVIEDPGPSKRMSYPEYTAKKNGRPSKYDAVRLDMQTCKQWSVTFKQFIREMQSLGYWFTKPQKYLYIHHASFPKGKRMINLGQAYSEENLRAYFRGWDVRPSLNIPPQIPAKNYVFSYDNWQTLVVNIVATIEAVRVCPDQNRAMYRLMADEIRKFEKRVEQQNLMLDYDLYTDEDVLRYKSECEAEIGELTEARQRFRNALKRAVRADDTEKICEYKDEISLLTQRLALMHNHIRICNSIVDDEPELELKHRQIFDLALEQERRQQQQIRNRNKGGYER